MLLMRMSAAAGLGFFAAGVVCGMVLEAAASVGRIAHPDGLWNHLKPGWLTKWCREADSRANEERARRAIEMDVQE